MGLCSEYESALQLIKKECGAVCPEFELCTHASCRSSCAAWMIADAALRGELGHTLYERENNDSSS